MKPNWALLGALRFALASIVLAAHLNAYVPGSAIAHALTGFNSFAAVVGFLLVSGFSIAASIDREPTGFYMRRVRRIMPVYLTCLLVAVVPFGVWSLIVGGSVAGLAAPSGQLIAPPTLLQILALLTMTQGFLIAVPVAFAPAWSLSIECLCYCLAPRLRKMPLWPVLTLTAASAGFFVLMPHVTTMWIAAGTGWMPWAALLWAWLLGWVLWFNRGHKWAILAAVGLPVALVSTNPQAGGPWTAGPLLVTSLVLLYSGRITLRPWLKSACNYAGELSYPLYLVHLPVVWIVAAATGWTSPAVYAVAGLLASVAIYHAIDKPLRRIKSLPKVPQIGVDYHLVDTMNRKLRRILAIIV